MKPRRVNFGAKYRNVVLSVFRPNPPDLLSSGSFLDSCTHECG